ncbi:MAG: hypothetical protein CMH70_02620 [Nitrosomonadaceae bacterium]|nr:hypothetical protein [Nitrosomonadaceae bacterium]|tara:strand:- start:3371 stop:3943 length:573 start_codon:yes stop_codon:yes gene_type:complete
MRKIELIIFIFFVFHSTAYTQDSLETSFDCTDVHIDYSNDPSLTRGERIHSMDKSFTKALNNFELCQAEKEKLESNDNSGGSANSAGSFEDVREENSVASPIISGKEFSSATDSLGEGTENNPAEHAISSKSQYGDNFSASNGKIHDDIPSVDNDSMLAAQIRHAAENETDPMKKTLLWKEYRKYKGLVQ